MQAQPDTSATSARAARRPRVGLITDIGRVDDGTFNQYAYEGLQRAAREFGLETTVIETQQLTDYQENVTQLAQAGYDAIVTVGFLLGEVTERLAPQYPDITFIVVDYTPTGKAGNVVGLVFSEDEAGFLAGALAGLMTRSNKVGVVAGMEIPPVIKFRRGFEHGAKHVNRRVKVLGTYLGTFSDPEVGQSAAEKLVAQGADVIFGAGGITGSGGVAWAAQQGTWAIGVDQDEWFTTFEKGAAAGSDKLLSSAVKRADQAVYAAVVRLVEDRLEPGSILFNIEENGVGLAEHHAAEQAIPAAVQERLGQIAEGLRRGTIHTCVGPRGEEVVEGFWARARALDWAALLTPILAIFTALVLSAVVILITDSSVWEAFGEGFFAGVGNALRTIGRAYGSLFTGALGNPSQIVQALFGGDSVAIRRAVYPITETLRIATPYIFTGLAVAVGFRSGLFNIGAEGQYFVGGLAAVFVGYSITGLPAIIHLPLAILAGMAGGALWAAIPGILKARTGAHEVINTIMMNYIAFRLAEFMLDVGGLMAREGFRPVSPEIQPSAYLPQFIPGDQSIRFNTGFLLALVVVGVVYWLLFKTTIGFELRTVGQNSRAARYAGISVPANIVLGMVLSGALAGLAADHDILGVLHFMPNAFFSGYGFDAIALALLGNSHPFGVLASALLFGALRAGAQNMQGVAQVPIDIISIMQGLIIVFIAAPAIVRSLYRIRGGREARVVLTSGWGQM